MIRRKHSAGTGMGSLFSLPSHGVLVRPFFLTAQKDTGGAFAPPVCSIGQIELGRGVRPPLGGPEEVRGMVNR